MSVVSAGGCDDRGRLHAPRGPASTVIAFELNGARVRVDVRPLERLSHVLRDRLGLTGTKVGCDAGDCGACSVLCNETLVCACLMPAGRLNGARVVTVEGLSREATTLNRLQRAFLHYGAAQCGICTPGMLLAATALLERTPRPGAAEVEDALSGVLCRCTGYRKIVRAVRAAHAFAGDDALPGKRRAVGAPMVRLDGGPKVRGSDAFGADDAPAGALVLRAIRSPHHRARFEFGDLDAFIAAHPGIELVLRARDVPGENAFGVIPSFRDQPVFAEGEARFRGEAVAAVVGTASAIDSLRLADFPVSFTELPAVLTIAEALAPDAPQLHAARTGNVLIGGLVCRGELEAGFAAARATVAGEFETGFIEHAYIEPEAGFARRADDRLEVHGCTQAPYMDRDGLARIMGLAPTDVRIVPTAVGGGFGSKLDLSFQPMIAIAAWRLGRPVRMVYSRPESMMSTTKRHPSRISIRVGADASGRLLALDFNGEFNTGAYASWGPTVANRVPVHASGPYYLPAYSARSLAVHTHCVPAGAFRGFGVPQAAIALECLLDELADRLAIDRLEFRIRNALEPGMPTVTGQVFTQGVGIRRCLEQLRPRWRQALEAAALFNNEAHRPLRRGVGIASCWYGCGNTSLPNPSTIRVGVTRGGRVRLHQGAVDIGQGANTVITQICADALGVEIAHFDLVSADTDLTPDAGKTSASRQTFVSGKAAYLAARELRRRILEKAGMTDEAALELGPGQLRIVGRERQVVFELPELAANDDGLVFLGEATFDPPTKPLDAHGQGEPYATYGFGAQLAVVEVDTALGTVKVVHLVAAHDVGRAINPVLAEGQIEGGVAQGIGMALMEAFIPGRSENLHDYLIPTFGDVPDVETILVEEPDRRGPFGAKGLGEHVLIPTAPAILNAIRHATGARIRKLPATPDRVFEALRDAALEAAR